MKVLEKTFFALSPELCRWKLLLFFSSRCKRASKFRFSNSSKSLKRRKKVNFRFKCSIFREYRPHIHRTTTDTNTSLRRIIIMRMIGGGKKGSRKCVIISTLTDIGEKKGANTNLTENELLLLRLLLFSEYVAEHRCPHSGARKCLLRYTVVRETKLSPRHHRDCRRRRFKWNLGLLQRQRRRRCCCYYSYLVEIWLA